MNLKQKGISFNFLVLLLILTPNLPMPAGGFGPIAPVLYILSFTAFIFFNKGTWTEVLKNNYIKTILILEICLLLSDFLRILLFDVPTEIYYPPIRLTNIFQIILFTFYFVDKKEDGSYLLNPFMVKVYVFSVLIACVILYGQALGIISFGMINQGRTFFGLQLPFSKPVGIFDLSDGKLGIMIAPLFYLFIINKFEKIRFHKLKYHFLIGFLLAVLIVLLQSRSAYLAFVISFFVFLVLYPSKFTKLLLGIGSVFFLMILFFTNIFKVIWIGLSGEGVYASNVEGRGDGLANSIDKFFESPLIGVGHKASRHIKGELQLGDGHIAHNIFLDHLSSGGLLAVVPLALIFFIFFYYGFKLLHLSKKLNNSKMVGVSIWLIVSMVYIFIELNFYRGLYNEYVHLYIAFGALLFLNYKTLTREKNTAHF